MIESPYLDLTPARETVVHRGVAMAAAYASAAEEYARATGGCVLFDRSDRGFLRASGEDRKSWLHNMLSNAVKTLDDGAGNYAFACDVRGRVQFDVNVLCRPDALWLDIDRSTVEGARRHLERFLITERVTLADESERFARLGCAGPRAAELAASLGVGNFAALPALASVALGAAGGRAMYGAGDGAPNAAGEAAPNAAGDSARSASGAARLNEPETWLVRHDFCGLPAFELVVPRGEAAAWWERLGAAGAAPAGVATRELLRIEAGIPAWGADIDDSVIPAETGQIERGISFNKGCYLGQEVIERMRSLGSPARRLVRLRVAGDASGLALAAPMTLQSDGGEVGRVTSLAAHPTSVAWIGLGYVKSAILAKGGGSIRLAEVGAAVEIGAVVAA